MADCQSRHGAMRGKSFKTLPRKQRRARQWHSGALLMLGVAMICPAFSADQTVLDRGAYLARAADCVACHTRPGGAPYAGGYGIQTPMGVIYSSNITPSKTQGIGRWSEAAFARAVRGGVSSNGVSLYPAMPYDSYAAMTDQDIHALYTYMQTAIEPIEDAAGPVTSLRFPYNIRGLMRVWNWLYLDRRVFARRQDETEEQARGRYLVEAVAHCGTCHTPRNFMMAARTGHALRGAQVGGWYAPDIAAGQNAPLASWRDQDIETYLRDGHVRDKGVAAGPMGEAVEHSLRFLAPQDLSAITAYLRTLKRPSVPEAAIQGISASAMVPATASHERPIYSIDSSQDRQTRAAARSEREASPAAYADRRNYRDISGGAALYMAACAACHQLDGSGTGDDYYPSLTQSRAVLSDRPNNLVMTILAGVHRQGADGVAFMPAFRHDLTDHQIAALANFITARFAGREQKLDDAKITALRRFDTEDFPARARP